MMDGGGNGERDKKASEGEGKMQNKSMCQLVQKCHVQIVTASVPDAYLICIISPNMAVT